MNYNGKICRAMKMLFCFLIVFLVSLTGFVWASSGVIQELEREIGTKNFISFHTVDLKFGKSYRNGLTKFLDERNLFSRSSTNDFIWAKKEVVNLQSSLISTNVTQRLELEESLVGLCKTCLARKLHHFLDIILDNREFRDYNDQSVFALRNSDEYRYDRIGVKFALKLLKSNITREQQDLVNRLLLLTPLDISFNRCIDVLKGNSFNLQNDAMQGMTLPAAIFVIHINTAQPWFTCFDKHYESNKNYYMNCVVSAIKNISEKVLGMSFSYDRNSSLSMRQQTIMSFIEQFNIPNPPKEKSE